MSKNKLTDKQKPSKSESKSYKDMYPNGGRPPTFLDADDMQKAIHRYFEHGVTIRQVEVGRAKDKRIELIPVPTITGLALYIGFCDRRSFYEYEEKEKFTHTVKRARAFIEKEYEEQLQVGNTTGAIFALKNMGWIDKTEVEQRNINEPPLFPDETGG